MQTTTTKATWITGAALGRGLAAAAAFAMTSLPVMSVWAQDTAATPTSSGFERWVEIAIVAALVAVMIVLRWLERPVRTPTGSWSRLEFPREEQRDFRLSGWRAEREERHGDDEERRA